MLRNAVESCPKHACRPDNFHVSHDLTNIVNNDKIRVKELNKLANRVRDNFFVVFPVNKNLRSANEAKLWENLTAGGENSEWLVYFLRRP